MAFTCEQPGVDHSGGSSEIGFGFRDYLSPGSWPEFLARARADGYRPLRQYLVEFFLNHYGLTWLKRTWQFRCDNQQHNQPHKWVGHVQPIALRPCRFR